MAELAAADPEILGREVALVVEVPEVLATRAVVVGVKTAVTFSLEAEGEGRNPRVSSDGSIPSEEINQLTRGGLRVRRGSSKDCLDGGRGRGDDDGGGGGGSDDGSGSRGRL